MKHAIVNKTVCISLIFLDVFGAASSSAASGPTTSHREQLVIMIDQENNEKLDSVDNHALTTDFSRMIGFKGDPFLTPILISKSIVVTLIKLNKRGDVDRYAGEIDWSLWDIYAVRGTQFMLFVPKGYVAMHADSGLNFASLDFEKIISLPEKFDIAPIEINLLDKIFRKKTDSITWDIIMYGHGAQQPPVIAGLSARKMQDVLKYFNTNINVAHLLIVSCYSGGENSKLLQFDQAVDHDALLTLHYPVILTSISDTGIYNNQLGKLKAFFDLTSQNASLADLVRALNKKDAIKRDMDPFLSTSLPQVWVPRGYGFQTYNVSDSRIKILSKSLVAAHEHEGRPIVIPKSAEIVLVYPQTINVPVIVEGPVIQFISMLKDQPNQCQHFASLNFVKKSALSSFLQHFVQFNKACFVIDELTCTEVPHFRRKTVDPKAVRLNLSPIASSSSDPNAIITGFSIQDLIDLRAFKYDLENGKITLDVSNMNIGSLAGFEQLPYRNMIYDIRVNGNLIEHIQSGLFQGFEALQHLQLTDNRIYHIAGDAFIGLKNLKSIDLARNNIEEISLPGLDSIEYLGLAFNRIRSINFGTNHPHLRRIILEDNGIVDPEVRARLEATVEALSPNANIYF